MEVIGEEKCAAVHQHRVFAWCVTFCNTIHFATEEYEVWRHFSYCQPPTGGVKIPLNIEKRLISDF